MSTNPVTAPDLPRAQQIAKEVFRDMPDADVKESFDEYVRRLANPSYPRSKS